MAKTSIKVRKIKTLNVCNFDLALLLVDSKNSLNELNKYVVFLKMYKGINRMRKKIFVIVTSAPPEKKLKKKPQHRLIVWVT